MFRITFQLNLCRENISGSDLLEKAFSTFDASNMVLQQQYHERNFKRYSDLISCMLAAEQNNELLMKNHQFLPTSSVTFPEVNATSTENKPLEFPEANTTLLTIAVVTVIVAVAGTLGIIMVKRLTLHGLRKPQYF